MRTIRESARVSNMAFNQINLNGGNVTNVIAQKKYLVFAGECYYASGGWKDLVFQSDSYDDASAHIRKLFFDVYGQVLSKDRWWQIVDTQLGYIVTEGVV